MDAPYQARDDTAAMRAGSGGVSICGIDAKKDRRSEVSAIARV